MFTLNAQSLLWLWYFLSFHRKYLAEICFSLPHFGWLLKFLFFIYLLVLIYHQGCKRQGELKLMDIVMQIFPLFYCLMAWKGHLYANKGLYKDIHSHFGLCEFPFLTLTWHILLKQTCPCLLLLCIFCLFLHLAHFPLIMFDTFETESLGFFFFAPIYNPNFPYKS